MRRNNFKQASSDELHSLSAPCCPLLAFAQRRCLGVLLGLSSKPSFASLRAVHSGLGPKTMRDSMLVCLTIALSARADVRQEVGYR